MNTSLAKHIFSLQSVPLYAIVLASLTSCGLLLMHMMGWQLWLMALLVLLVWSPILAMKTRDIYRQSRWLAFFFVLLVAQSVHFTEHIAQMVQIHLVGLSGTQAHGIIGMLDLEWVHFLFDAGWVPICVYTLFVIFRKSPRCSSPARCQFQLLFLAGSGKARVRGMCSPNPVLPLQMDYVQCAHPVRHPHLLLNRRPGGVRHYEATAGRTPRLLYSGGRG